ncbi:hypothetical protein EDD16DRAFT_887486 [Pisolithus croceorrhizus]|nr:hypothetical protein EDD16DRAFT_887486 [Pisolithus croceorrhizus]
MLGSLTCPPPKLESNRKDHQKLSTCADRDRLRKRKRKNDETRLALSLRSNQPHGIVQGNSNLSTSSTLKGADANSLRLITWATPLRPICLPAGFFSAGYPSFTAVLLGFLQDTPPFAPRRSGNSSSSAVVSRAVDSLHFIASKVPRRIPSIAISGCAPDARRTLQARDLRITRVSVTDRDGLLFLRLPRRSIRPAGTMAPSSDRECPLKQASWRSVIPGAENNRHNMHGIANGNKRASGKWRNSDLLSIKYKNEEINIGFPEDMVDILQQLEVLADWVRATSHKKVPAASGTKCLRGNHHPSRWTSPTSRHMASSTTPCEGQVPMPYSNALKSEQRTYVNASDPATTRAFPTPAVAHGYCGASDSPHDPHVCPDYSSKCLPHSLYLEFYRVPGGAFRSINHSLYSPWSSFPSATFECSCNQSRK